MLPELRELQDVQQIEGSAMSFSGHEYVFVYRFCCSIYKLDIFMALAADAVFVCWTKKFRPGRRWSEVGKRLGDFHQHNELIRLCWLFIEVCMENGNNKSPAICNYLCRWVRLMFISLCQLAAPAPIRCLCLCPCHLHTIRHKVEIFDIYAMCGVRCVICDTCVMTIKTEHT